MSDSISSASNTITSQLSSSGTSFLGKPDCTMSNIRFVMFICLLLLFVCFCMSLVSQACYESAPHPTNRVSNYKRACGCSRCKRVRENFSNDDTYSYSAASSASYQSIPLTSPDTSENTPSNLLFGQANRYISTDDNELIYTLDIHANLYVLNGNTFQKGDPPNHSYKAYLGDDSKEINIGTLTKDGDGIYKLKFTSKNTKELTNFRSLKVVYDKDTEKQTLLVGNFA